MLVNTQALADAAASIRAIGANIEDATSAALAPITNTLAMGGDEVSAAVSGMFNTHGREYRSASAQAAAFHDQFMQTLTGAGAAYAAAEAANTHPLLDAVNAAVFPWIGRPLIGDGANGATVNGVGTKGGDGGLLWGNGGRGGDSTAVNALGGDGGAGGFLAGNGGNGGNGGVGYLSVTGIPPNIDVVSFAGGRGGAGGSALLFGIGGAGGAGGPALMPFSIPGGTGFAGGSGLFTVLLGSLGIRA